jgi:NAD-dependent dihydropyrimidine dehydrogenase PreA subunit
MIYSSTEYLTRYLQEFNFTSIFKEEAFMVPLKPTFSLDPKRALYYLIASASVGNKALGLFEKLPPLPELKNLRGTCLLFSLSLPEDLSIPTFFCRSPEDSAELLPLAGRIAGESPYPVHIVLSQNVFNNYTGQTPPAESTVRLSPYISSATLSAAFDEEAAKARLTQLCDILPPEKELGSEIAFELPKASFPRYIMPLGRKEYNVKNARTTAASYAFLKGILGRNTKLVADLSAEEKKGKPYLCPGCPVGTIFTRLNLSESLVASSLSCPAIYELFDMHRMALTSYLGLISNGLNTPSVFIGNASRIRGAQPEMMKNGVFIALDDDNGKALFSNIGNPRKLKSLKNMTFPYACNNIKRYSPPKVKAKKCTCTGESTTPCVEKTRCPALYFNDSINIDKELCTGCGSCIVHCQHGAIS